MLSFKTKGLIDPKAYTLIGASVKVNENPIGYFGTGLKYAIAVFLRNGCRVIIWRGHDKTDFITRQDTFRSQPITLIDAVTDRGSLELPYTLDYGKKWEPWQAMRELWCNTKDEGGTISNEYLPHEEGYTTIYIQGAAADKAWDERNNVFLMTSPIFTSEGVEVHDRPSNHIYFKGVRVFDTPKPCKFTYNIVGKAVDLTEDRTIKYEFLSRSCAAHALMSCNHNDTIKALMQCNSDYYEHGWDFSVHHPSPTFLEVLRTETKLHFSMNSTLMKVLREHRGMKDLLRPVTPTKVESVVLARAIKAAEALGANLELYPITITEGLETGVLALADMKENRIYLSRELFKKGTKYVAIGLYEEFLHLHERLPDCSRELQTNLLEKIFSLHEEMKGEPL